MGHKTYYFNSSSSDALPDGQTAAVRINAQVDVYDFATIPKKFISVSLAGSNVAASTSGNLGIDRDDKRGFFTESAVVSMALSGSRFAIEQDSPSTTMGQEATTSTTSIGVNVSAGTFGDTPTTNVGGGVTIGSSFSRNLTDFRVVNNSDDHRLLHRYLLAASSGGSYDEPKDLLDMSVGGQFTGACLFKLPPISVSNLPLASQAIFIADADPDETSLQLSVSVQHNLREVEKTFELFVVKVDTWTRSWTSTLTESIPLATA
jgi:hypothetical protein